MDLTLANYVCLAAALVTGAVIGRALADLLCQAVKPYRRIDAADEFTPSVRRWGYVCEKRGTRS